MVRLTEKLVLEKTKCTSLYGVRNINLWGSSLDDVDVVQRMPNLESLSLSVNRVASLRVFARCPNLVDLHLRKNDIADLDIGQRSLCSIVLFLILIHRYNVGKT